MKHLNKDDELIESFEIILEDLEELEIWETLSHTQQADGSSSSHCARTHDATIEQKRDEMRNVLIRNKHSDRRTVTIIK